MSRVLSVSCRAAAGVFLAAVAGCTSPGALDPDAAAQARVATADAARQRGDLTGAEALYDAVLAAEVPGPAAVRARLGRADCRLQRGARAAGRLDAELALALLDAVPLDARDRRNLAAAGERLLGDSELTAGDPLAARERYQRALALETGARAAAALRFRLHLAALRAGRADEAAAYLARIRDRDDPELAALAARFPPPPPPVAAVPSRPAAPIASLPVLERERWRAATPHANKDPMTRIHRVTVHHSGTWFDRLDVDASAHHIRSIQRVHQEGNGWADIGYHYVIDRAGRLWEGRDLRHQGAHAGNFDLNRGNVGVCVLGDYREQELTAGQRRTLFDLLRFLRERYDVPPDGFYTHREIRESHEHGSTACPGVHLTRALDEFRDGDATALTRRPR